MGPEPLRGRGRINPPDQAPRWLLVLDHGIKNHA